MKILATAAVVALAALSLTACGTSSPAGESSSAASEPVPTVDVQLPAAAMQRGQFVVGINCDYPPAGSVDLKGKHVGYEN